MQILSERLVHHNVGYYDIEAAGPTTLVEYGLWDPGMLKLPKDKRNIEYGKFCKHYNLTRLIYSIYSSFTKILAIQSQAVLITPDSLVSSFDPRDLTIAKKSFYTIKQKWKASILILSYDKKSYFAIDYLNNNRIIAKGPIAKFIPVGCVRKLIKTYQLGGNWLRTYKAYYKNAPISDFITPDNLLILKRGIYEIGQNVSDILFTDIDREKYWRIICMFTFSLYQSWR